jgi:hypothetical protein
MVGLRQYLQYNCLIYWCAMLKSEDFTTFDGLTKIWPWPMNRGKKIRNLLYCIYPLAEFSSTYIHAGPELWDQNLLILVWFLLDDFFIYILFCRDFIQFVVKHFSLHQFALIYIKPALKMYHSSPKRLHF